MHIHVLGICGTFMAGLALLARAQGHRVSGSDAQAYPPMSTLLQKQGVSVLSGYEPAHLEPAPDLVVVGNALSRGNPALEHVLDRGLPYTSGPQWLAEHVLQGRWVLAVAGTHGKTTTASLLAWLLEAGGLRPGFLIGGVPENFGVSARLGDGELFVVEADEYDTAFFDKRSKFVHYRPRTAVLNNLEYDHADIFPDLAAIQTQFHHLLRTVPAGGRVILPAGDANLEAVLQRGVWTPVEHFAVEAEALWQARELSADAGRFALWHQGQRVGEAHWPLAGRHNVHNALAALAAAAHAGLDPRRALPALAGFRSVKRRLEVLGDFAGVRLYDDFAHHPTAVAATLAALRGRVGRDARIIAVLEPRSNTMRLGVHRATLAASLQQADSVHLFRPAGLDWDLQAVAGELDGRARVHEETAALIAALQAELRPGDHVLIMSNGAFEGLHGRLAQALSGPAAAALQGGST